MITYAQTDAIAQIVIDNPPVNALGVSLVGELLDAIARAEQDGKVSAILIRAAGRLFSAGADINEFKKPEDAPRLPTLIDRIESCSKPVIAVIHGQCLGGGLELALGCHYRIAARNANLALPEVQLGLLPGAGGTQRLPRLIGMNAAINMIATGTGVSAEKALSLGLVDRLADDDAVIVEALEFAGSLTGVRRTCDLPPPAIPSDLDAHLAPHLQSHFDSVQACAAAIHAAAELPFMEGMAREAALFEELLQSDQARALQHVFFAERKAAKIEGLPAKIERHSVERVGVIGAGTMGSGIAINFLLAGIPVTLVETNAAPLQRGADGIARILATSVSKGRLTEDQRAKATDLLNPSLAFDDLGQCDLIIEAVFEDMSVKLDIFRRLDALAKPNAILASNTSFLDINEMASATARPEAVVGLHFFSPANVMKLVEVIRGDQTSNEVLATCMKITQRIGKVPVLSGVCHGFIGNRMLLPRLEQAKQLLLEGAAITQIDEVSTRLGLPMGPLQMIDLAGVDIGWHRDVNRIENLNDALCARGRLGQKSSAGYYDYDDRRKPVPSTEVGSIVEQFRNDAAIERRTISDDEIIVRTVYVMINEAALILEEGIAQRPSDIDVVWMLGFGWPRWTGGPLWWASEVGVSSIVAGLERYRSSFGPDFRIASSLLKFEADSQSFYSRG
ncbi:3-hydroxyacyl-CoA dehydrogenase NAD-binding domain-containing protein [Novosphingobium aquae]|uniref:3-hydroxyacyl-CoA dehydrogenase NAD-binding domain-containing protein n=1 Tax=Novosphingobium aquae TaxID=3133435 RepID=A0ABU8S964_9SPHN